MATGIVSSAQFGYLLDPGLRKIFWDQYREIPSMIPNLFDVQTSSKATEEDTSIGGMGDFPEFEGRVQYDSVDQLWKPVYRHTEYAKGFQIERTLYDDDQYSVINRQPQRLAMSAWRTREAKAAEVFNNATSAVGFDGVVLGSASHPLAPGSSSTQSNLFAYSLSAANLSTVRLAMRAWTDDRGNLANIRPDTLLVPPELWETARKIVESPQGYESGSADFTPNVHAGQFRLMSWEYLTDANRWFLIDSQMMKQFLLWFDRVPLEFAMTDDFDTLVAKWRAYMRFSCGYSDWRWVAVCEPS